MFPALNAAYQNRQDVTANRNQPHDVLKPGTARLPHRRGHSTAPQHVGLEQLLAFLLPVGTPVPLDAARILTGARSANSLAAMVSDLRCFARFCQSHADSTPSQCVVDYLSALRRQKRSPATILRHAASLNQACVSVGAPSLLDHEGLRDMLAQLRARKRPAKPASLPLRHGDGQVHLAPALTLEVMLLACTDDCVGYRDAALLSLGYELGLGASDLITVINDQVIAQADGTGLIQFDQDTRAAITRATMQRIARWRAAGSIADGPLFRRIAIQRHDAVPARAGARPSPAYTRYLIGDTKLTRQGLNVIWRRLAYRAADLGLVDLYGNTLTAALAALSTRSLRAGRALDTASIDLSVRKLDHTSIVRRRKAATVSGFKV